MEPFPISYDAANNTLLLSGKGGAQVLLALLLRAKFGDAFEPETLFHEPLANVMIALQRECGQEGDLGGPFTREQLVRVADEIVSESWRSGWWAMTESERVAFVQEVIVAPYRLSAEQMSELLCDVDEGLAARRQIAAAAERAL